MKQLPVIVLMLICSGLAAGCDSVTGDIIDDYKRAKSPVAQLKNLPDAVTTERSISITVGGRDMSRYIYRINGGPWSSEHRVSVPITMPDLDYGKHRLEVAGSINGSHWQSTDRPTVYTWEIIPRWSCLKKLWVNKGNLFPAFNPYITGDLDYTVTLSEQETSVEIGKTLYDEGAGVTYRVYEAGTAQGEFVDSDDTIIVPLEIDKTCILEIRVSSEKDGQLDPLVYTLSLTRESRKWSEPVQFAEGYESKVVVDNNGVVTIIYTAGSAYPDYTGDPNEIWAVTYTQEDGFGSPQLIGQNETGFVMSLNVCNDDYGNILVVWLNVQKIGTTYPDYPADVWGNYYVKGKGWQKAGLLENGSQSAFYLKATCNGNGNAIISWVYTDLYTDEDVEYMLYVRHFDFTNGWKEIEKIDETDTDVEFNHIVKPKIVYDLSGNAYLAWFKMNNGNRFFVKKYNRNGIWENTIVIDQVSTSISASVDNLIFDRNGNGFLFYGYGNNNGEDYRKYVVRYTPEEGWGKSTNLGYCISSHAAVDGNGNVILLYSHNNNIFIRRYVNLNGWQEPDEFVLNKSYDAFPLGIYCDYNDNFIICWLYNNENTYNSLQVCRFNFLNGWSNEYEIYYNTTNDYFCNTDLVSDFVNNIYLVYNTNNNQYNHHDYKSWLTILSN